MFNNCNGLIRVVVEVLMDDRRGGRSPPSMARLCWGWKKEVAMAAKIAVIAIAVIAVAVLLLRSIPFFLGMAGVGHGCERIGGNNR